MTQRTSDQEDALLSVKINVSLTKKINANDLIKWRCSIKVDDISATSDPVIASGLNVEIPVNCRLSSIILVEIERPSKFGVHWKSVGQYEGIIVNLYHQFPNVIQDFNDEKVARMNLRLTEFDNLDITLRNSVGEALQRLDDSNIGKLTDVVDGVSQLIQTFAFALKPLYSVIDAFSQSHPILQAAWTVLTSVYNVVKAQKLQDENIKRLSESFLEMTTLLNACRDLPQLHKTDHVLTDIGIVGIQVATLIDAYSRRGSNVLTRAIKRLFKDFKPNIDKFETQYEELRKKLCMRIAINTGQEVRYLVDRAMVSDLKEQIDPPKYEERYAEAKSLHLEGTNQWIWENKDFEAWRHDEFSTLLLTGGSGSGKTILWSTVARYAEQDVSGSEGSGFAYFSFDGRSSEAAMLATYTAFLRAVIHQLCQQLTKPPKRIPASVLSLNLAKSSSNVQLAQTLEETIACFKSVRFFVDGLDECLKKDHNTLLTWIETASQKPDIAIFVTSQPWPNIVSHFNNKNSRQINIDSNQEVKDDIGRFIEEKVDGNSIWEDQCWADDKLQIIKAMRNAAGGMFRFAELQFIAIQDLDNLDDIEKLLSELPPDMITVYDRLLEMQGVNKLGTLRILQVVLYSRYPVGAREVAEIIGVSALHSERPLFKAKSCPKPPGQAVFNRCRGFITRFSTHDWEDFLVLAHGSVKDYLLALPPVDNWFSFEEKLSHSIIAKTCLTYIIAISQSEQTFSRETIQKYPFAQHSARQWPYHVNKAGKAFTDDDMINMKAVLQEPAFRAWLTISNWLESAAIPGYEYECATPLYYASLKGVVPAVKILRAHADVNTEGRTYGLAIQVAAGEGHRDVVKLLIEANADVNLVVLGKYDTAIQAAALSGRKYIVKMLVKGNADVNIPGGHYDTVIHAAVVRGHRAIAKLLIEADAAVHLVAGQPSGTAIQAATLNGHEDIVEMLITEGNADVNIVAGMYGTAIQAAAALRHRNIVELLIQAKANVNIVGGEYGTAIQAAAHCLNLASHPQSRSVTRLSDNNPRKKYVMDQYRNIMTMLIKAGADPNGATDYTNICQEIVESPIRLSERHGWSDIVQLLLDAGAVDDRHLDIEDWDSRSEATLA